MTAAQTSTVPQNVSPPLPVAHQFPPPNQFRQPAKRKTVGLTALILACVAIPLLLYPASQMVLRPLAFRREAVSMWTLGFGGVAMTLGILMTCLSVLAGLAALVLSFVNKERWGGRLPALIGPLLCVLVCALTLGLFTYRRIQGPPRYDSPDSYSPSSPSDTTNSDSNSNSNSRTSSGDMTEEEKYRLFYAATKTEDKFLQSEAAKKIGIIDESGQPTSSYQTFVKNAMSWAMGDVAFIRSVDTPEKARTYVNAHMDY